MPARQAARGGALPGGPAPAALGAGSGRRTGRQRPRDVASGCGRPSPDSACLAGRDADPARGRRPRRELPRARRRRRARTRARWSRGAAGAGRASRSPTRSTSRSCSSWRGFGHVLSSQIHRRYHPARALTTTQRRLKRLADAGWIDALPVPPPRRRRRSDVLRHLARPASQLLAARDRLPAAAASGAAPSPPRDGATSTCGRARHEVHVAGWVLALQRCAGGGVDVRARAAGRACSRRRAASAGRAGRPSAPDDLRLPGRARAARLPAHGRPG